MSAFWNWCVSHPEALAFVAWAVLTAVGVIWPESSIGKAARRIATDLRGPAKVTEKASDDGAGK